MKKLFFTVATICLLAGCGPQKPASPAGGQTDTTSLPAGNAQLNPASASDKNQYDQSFIEGIAEQNGKVKLAGNYMLLEMDTVYFPEDLPLDREIIFTGSKNDKSFILKITRTNFTNLRYDFEQRYKNDQHLASQSGIAILGSQFFLATETDDDDAGEAYASTEYRDNSSGCPFAIRIGEKDEKGRPRAKVILECGDETAVELDDSPVLRPE